MDVNTRPVNTVVLMMLKVRFSGIDRRRQYPSPISSNYKDLNGLSRGKWLFLLPLHPSMRYRQKPEDNTWTDDAFSRVLSERK